MGFSLAPKKKKSKSHSFSASATKLYPPFFLSKSHRTGQDDDSREERRRHKLGGGGSTGGDRPFSKVVLPQRGRREKKKKLATREIKCARVAWFLHALLFLFFFGFPSERLFRGDRGGRNNGWPMRASVGERTPYVKITSTSPSFRPIDG